MTLIQVATVEIDPQFRSYALKSAVRPLEDVGNQKKTFEHLGNILKN